jgi:hypothetical protein
MACTWVEFQRPDDISQAVVRVQTNIGFAKPSVAVTVRGAICKVLYRVCGRLIG